LLEILLYNLEEVDVEKSYHRNNILVVWINQQQSPDQRRDWRRD